MMKRFRSGVLSVVGAGFLGLAWAKNKFFGYSTPNLVPPSDDEGRILYVIDTFDTWRRYLPPGFDLSGKDVLEVSPGSSRGAGALFLAAGARSYHAIDAFGLAEGEAPNFYANVVARWRAGQGDANFAAPAAGDRSISTYAVGHDFDIARLCGGRTFDLIVSCAAFEHYPDIALTIAGQTTVARCGCVAVHVVDLQTHSRWVRDFDPNNIYRFADWFYRIFAFPGQPNRKRPADYTSAYVAAGWHEVRFMPVSRIASDRVETAIDGLASAFRKDDRDMTVLNGVLVARMP